MLKSFDNYNLLSEIDFNLLNTPPGSQPSQSGVDPFMKELFKIENALISLIETQFKALEQTLTGHVQSQMRSNRPLLSKLRNWWRKTWNPGVEQDESFDPGLVLNLPEHIKLELPSFINLQEERVIEELSSILNEGPIQDTMARVAVELQRLKQELIANVFQAFRSIAQGYQASAQQAPAPQSPKDKPFDWKGKLKAWQDSQPTTPPSGSSTKPASSPSPTPTSGSSAKPATPSAPTSTPPPPSGSSAKPASSPTPAPTPSGPSAKPAATPTSSGPAASSPSPTSNKPSPEEQRKQDLEALAQRKAAGLPPPPEEIESDVDREERERLEKEKAAQAVEAPPEEPAAPPEAPPSEVVPGKKPPERKSKLKGPNIGAETPPVDEEPPVEEPVADEEPPVEEPSPEAPAEEPTSDKTPETPADAETPPSTEPKIKAPRLGRLGNLGGRLGVLPSLLSEPDEDDPNATPPPDFGVIPYHAGRIAGAKPLGKVDPDELATRVDKPHFNVAQKNIKDTMEFWGPNVQKFYKELGRDSVAKKNAYNFLSMMGYKNRGQISYLKTFPLAKVLNWVQAFTPEQQDEIAVRLPYLDDGMNEEDPSVTQPFWERVDKDSFYKAVLKTLGNKFKPDYDLMAKYVEGNLKDRVKTLCELLKGPYQSVGKIETPEGTLSERLEKYRQMLGN